MAFAETNVAELLWHEKQAVMMTNHFSYSAGRLFRDGHLRRSNGAWLRRHPDALSRIKCTA